MNYEEFGRIIGQLVDYKQKLYGDAFHKSGRVLEILYPDGVKPQDYESLLAVTRIIDKLFRVASSPKDLSEDPFADIAGYGLLGARKPSEDPEDE